MFDVISCADPESFLSEEVQLCQRCCLFFVDSEIQIPLNVFAHFLVKADALTTIFKLQLYAHCHLALNNHPDDQAARINAYYSLRHRLGQGCISFVIRYTFPPLS